MAADGSQGNEPTQGESDKLLNRSGRQPSAGDSPNRSGAVDQAALQKLNRRLANVNAEYAELMADLDSRNVALQKTNQELARVNACAAELMANLELREDEIRSLNRSISAANASAAELLADRELHLDQLSKLNRELRREIREKEEAFQELSMAMKEIKSLQSILPICSFCKKIRDGSGYWNEVEAYISTRTDTRFSHSFCDKCLAEHYPED